MGGGKPRVCSRHQNWLRKMMLDEGMAPESLPKMADLNNKRCLCQHPDGCTTTANYRRRDLSQGKARTRCRSHIPPGEEHLWHDPSADNRKKRKAEEKKSGKKRKREVEHEAATSSSSASSSAASSSSASVSSSKRAKSTRAITDFFSRKGKEEESDEDE